MLSIFIQRHSFPDCFVHSTTTWRFTKHQRFSHTLITQRPTRVIQRGWNYRLSISRSYSRSTSNHNSNPFRTSRITPHSMWTCHCRLREPPRRVVSSSSFLWPLRTKQFVMVRLYFLPFIIIFIYKTILQIWTTFPLLYSVRSLLFRRCITTLFFFTWFVSFSLQHLSVILYWNDPNFLPCTRVSFVFDFKIKFSVSHMSHERAMTGLAKSHHQRSCSRYHLSPRNSKTYSMTDGCPPSSTTRTGHSGGKPFTQNFSVSRTMRHEVNASYVYWMTKNLHSYTPSLQPFQILALWSAAFIRRFTLRSRTGKSARYTTFLSIKYQRLNMGRSVVENDAPSAVRRSSLSFSAV
jgi:hypothetical protein